MQLIFRRYAIYVLALKIVPIQKYSGVYLIYVLEDTPDIAKFHLSPSREIPDHISEAGHVRHSAPGNLVSLSPYPPGVRRCAVRAFDETARAILNSRTAISLTYLPRNSPDTEQIMHTEQRRSHGRITLRFSVRDLHATCVRLPRSTPFRHLLYRCMQIT